MKQYPKWLLALTFPSVIIPMGTMIFYLFGEVYPFGKADDTYLNFLFYLLSQLLWLFPIGGFFCSLFLWGWMREKLSVAIATLSLLVALTSVWLLAPHF